MHHASFPLVHRSWRRDDETLHGAPREWGLAPWSGLSAKCERKRFSGEREVLHYALALARMIEERNASPLFWSKATVTIVLRVV